jgi:hypothetical protein
MSDAFDPAKGADRPRVGGRLAPGVAPVAGTVCRFSKFGTQPPARRACPS